MPRTWGWMGWAFLIGCGQQVGPYLDRSFIPPQSWVLYDGEGRAVTVHIEPTPEGIQFQAGPVEIWWQEGGGGYTEQDTVEILDGDQIRSWFFPPFLVYPLPPLPGLHYRETFEHQETWGLRTVDLQAIQDLRVEEGPKVVLVRSLKVDGEILAEEQRILQFYQADLKRFYLFRQVQRDTLILNYTMDQGF